MHCDGVWFKGFGGGSPYVRVMAPTPSMLMRLCGLQMVCHIVVGQTVLRTSAFQVSKACVWVSVQIHGALSCQALIGSCARGSVG